MINIRYENQIVCSQDLSVAAQFYCFSDDHNIRKTLTYMVLSVAESGIKCYWGNKVQPHV